MAIVTVVMSDLEDIDSTNKVWFLQENHLFAGLPFEAESYAHLFELQLLPKRTRLFDLGDPSKIMFLIKRGAVRIARMSSAGKDVTVAVLGPGDLFGEETLFDASRERTTTATTLEETLICTCHADALLEIVARDPHMMRNVAHFLSDQNENLSERIERNATASVSDRIMLLFGDFAKLHGVRNAVGVTVPLNLTHAEIADLVSSTRETVTLEIAKLRRAGRIVTESGSLTIVKAPIDAL